MIAKIQKWGNSLGLRIPRSFAREVRVRSGSTVDLSVKGGRLVVSPLISRKYALEDLLAGITRANLHGEENLGAPLGRELL